jgi:formylglycine-generating enzyme required for sulfatase activity
VEKIRQDAEEKARKEMEEKKAAETSARQAADELARQEREKREWDAAEKTALEKAEREAVEKVAHEKTEREAAEKSAREKAELEAVERAKNDSNKKETEIQDRILEAAIEKEITVGKAAQLFILVKQIGSKGILSVIKSVDEEIVLNESNVKTRGIQIEFPVENHESLPAEITLRLDAPDFSIPIKEKYILIPPDSDSELTTFMVTPTRAGELVINIEVLKGKNSLAAKVIRTIAITTDVPNKSFVLFRMPIVIFAQSPILLPKEKEDPKNISVRVEGDVQGNIIIGDNNRIAQESRRKAEREISEREATERNARNSAELARPSMPQIEKTASTTTLSKKQSRRAINTQVLLALIGFVGIIVATLISSPALVEHIWERTIPTVTPSPFSTFTMTPVPTSTPTKMPAPTSTPAKIPAPTKTPTLTPFLEIGSTMISNKDGMILLYVPAGEFTMGSDKYISNIHADERPMHKVTLPSFWMDQTEVTNKMYALCVKAEICQPPNYAGSTTHNKYYGTDEFAEYPVLVGSDWNRAKTYCEWAGRRLPTEAEWEKAARGTDARIYPWGNKAPTSNLANYNSIIGDTTKVGNYPAGASPYGVLDMAGNVWEWVSSLYKSYPYSATDGRENLNTDGARVLRGGSWLDSAYNVRSGVRPFGIPPIDNTLTIGFRCARDANP